MIQRNVGAVYEIYVAVRTNLTGRGRIGLQLELDGSNWVGWGQVLQQIRLEHACSIMSQMLILQFPLSLHCLQSHRLVVYNKRYVTQRCFVISSNLLCLLYCSILVHFEAERTHFTGFPVRDQRFCSGL